MDWTHGLDSGLKFELGFGLARRAVTTISSYKSYLSDLVLLSQLPNSCSVV